MTTKCRKNSPPTRRELVGEIDDRIVDRMRADQHVLVEPPGELPAIALQVSEINVPTRGPLAK